MKEAQMPEKYMVVLKDYQVRILEEVLEAHREKLQQTPGHWAKSELKALKDIETALRRKAKIH
jgi:hypothetical protein